MQASRCATEVDALRLRHVRLHADCAGLRGAAEKRKFVSNIYYIRDYAVTPGDGIPTLVRSQFDLARAHRCLRSSRRLRSSRVSRLSASSLASMT